MHIIHNGLSNDFQGDKNLKAKSVKLIMNIYFLSCILESSHVKKHIDLKILF